MCFWFGWGGGRNSYILHIGMLKRIVLLQYQQGEIDYNLSPLGIRILTAVTARHSRTHRRGSRQRRFFACTTAARTAAQTFSDQRKGREKAVIIIKILYLEKAQAECN
jgi:hypothetical protein